MSIITGSPTHSVGGQYCFALCRLSSSVGVCNTPWLASMRLHPLQPGDDVMPPPV